MEKREREREGERELCNKRKQQQETKAMVVNIVTILPKRILKDCELYLFGILFSNKSLYKYE